jgi:hypothetical protein
MLPEFMSAEVNRLRFGLDQLAPAGSASQDLAAPGSQLGTIWAQSASALVVPHERLLTVREAAARLGSQRRASTTCARVETGAHRVGNAIRIAPADLKVVERHAETGRTQRARR